MLILHDVTELFTSEAGLRKNQDVLEQNLSERTLDIEKRYTLAIHLANLGSDQHLDDILALKIKSLTGVFLVSNTEYLPEKQALEKQELAHHLARAGSEFDPAVVETFMRLLDEPEHQITL
jgi:hypothetical protein